MRKYCTQFTQFTLSAYYSTCNLCNVFGARQEWSTCRLLNASPSKARLSLGLSNRKSSSPLQVSPDHHCHHYHHRHFQHLHHHQHHRHNYKHQHHHLGHSIKHHLGTFCLVLEQFVSLVTLFFSSYFYLKNLSQPHAEGKWPWGDNTRPTSQDIPLPSPARTKILSFFSETILGTKIISKIWFY